MSDTNPPVGGGPQDLISAVKSIVIYLGKILTTLMNLFPRVTGTFTMTATTTLAVANSAINANAIIQLIPTNAAAATEQASTNALYVSLVTGGTGFTVASASGNGTAGATYSYVVWNPV